MSSKFQLGEKVWFLGDSKILNREITGVKSQLKGEFHPFCKSLEFGYRLLKSISDKEEHFYNFEYSKCGFTKIQKDVPESRLFKTKEELIASL